MKKKFIGLQFQCSTVYNILEGHAWYRIFSSNFILHIESLQCFTKVFLMVNQRLRPVVNLKEKFIAMSTKIVSWFCLHRFYKVLKAFICFFYL